MFLGLDSYEFPMRNYGDIAFRLYGSIFRYIVNILQSIQLLCGVGLIVISNGQAISQVSKFRLCYAVCCLIWAIVGFAVGQVRTLAKYGWLANAAVWLNLMIMFISMGTSLPNWESNSCLFRQASLLTPRPTSLFPSSGARVLP